MTVLPRVEVAEYRPDASGLLRAINAACEQATRADEAKKLVRAVRPALEALLGRAGLSADLAELFADPGSHSQRETLMLPIALAQAAFGAERPYETMWVSQRAALSALQSGTGELTGFDADQAIAAAHREL